MGPMYDHGAGKKEQQLRVEPMMLVLREGGFDVLKWLLKEQREGLEKGVVSEVSPKSAHSVETAD